MGSRAPTAPQTVRYPTSVNPATALSKLQSPTTRCLWHKSTAYVIAAVLLHRIRRIRRRRKRRNEPPVQAVKSDSWHVPSEFDGCQDPHGSRLRAPKERRLSRLRGRGAPRGFFSPCIYAYI